LSLGTARDLLIKGNKQAFDAAFSNDISKMEMLFKSGGIEQGAIDHLIFGARSVKMLRLFLRYGGDMHKLSPPYYPYPRTLLLNCTGDLRNYADDSSERRELVKLIEFLIEEGANVNAVEEHGNTPFINCASDGETELCKFLVERGADPSAKRYNGWTALHDAAQFGIVTVFRYLVEDCGLGIDVEYRDENMNPRTPLFLAAWYGNMKACRYLLETGAKVNTGRQPLIVAAQV
jgi:ankyrin repeat protein